jgi:hypothetical protein
VSTQLPGPQVWLGALALNVIDGAGTAWTVTDETGWPGSPASTVTVTPREADHGGWAGTGYLASKTLAPVVTLTAPTITARDAAIDTLIAAASLGPTTWRVASGGLDRWVGVLRQGEPLVTRYGTSADVSLSLVAPDPRKYSTAAYTGSCSLPSSSGGLTFPITFPITFGATVSSSGAITLGNAGNIGSRPLLRILGPATQPLITLQLPDGSVQQLIYQGTLGALDYLDLDCDAHRCTLNSTANRRGLLTVQTTWPEIPAASSGLQMNFNASAGGSATALQATWYDAWQ